MQNEKPNQDQIPAPTSEKSARPQIKIPKPLTTAEKIRRLRGTEKQETIAKKLGIHQSYLSKIEKGTAIPDNDKLQEFARKLGVSIIDILADNTNTISISGLHHFAFCLNCVKTPELPTHLGNHEELKSSYDYGDVKYGSQYILPVIDEDNSENKYCDLCSRKLVKECPDCGKAINIREIKTPFWKTFCRYCGRLLIPNPHIYYYENNGWSAGLIVKSGRIHPFYLRWFRDELEIIEEEFGIKSDLVEYSDLEEYSDLVINYDKFSIAESDYFRARVISSFSKDSSYLHQLERPTIKDYIDIYDREAILFKKLISALNVVENKEYINYMKWAKEEYDVGPGFPNWEDDLALKLLEAIEKKKREGKINCEKDFLQEWEKIQMDKFNKQYDEQYAEQDYVKIPLTLAGEDDLKKEE